MDFSITFSVRLRELREARSLKQPALANAIHISKQTINDFEHARTNPSVKTLLALADYFDVSLDYLVGRSDDPTRLP